MTGGGGSTWDHPNCCTVGTNFEFNSPSCAKDQNNFKTQYWYTECNTPLILGTQNTFQVKLREAPQLWPINPNHDLTDWIRCNRNRFHPCLFFVLLCKLSALSYALHTGLILPGRATFPTVTSIIYYLLLKYEKKKKNTKEEIQLKLSSEFLHDVCSESQQ